MSQIIAVDVSEEKSFFVSVVRSIAAWLWKFGRCCFFHFVCAGLCAVIYTVFTPILHHIVSFIIIYLHAFNELLIKVKVNKKPFCCLPTEVTQKTQNKCISNILASTSTWWLFPNVLFFIHFWGSFLVFVFLFFPSFRHTVFPSPSLSASLSAFIFNCLCVSVCVAVYCC